MIAKIWKKKGLFGALFVLAVLVLFGCDFSSRKTIGSGYDVWQFGIVSDTTAMLAVRYWDQFEDNAGDGYDYLGWGLMLVDVRYRHVYWENKIEDHGQINASQLTDSTMLFWNWSLDETVGNIFWLWKAGGQPSDSMQLSWTTDNINMFRSYIRVRPWRNGKFLAISGSAYALLDTSAGIMSQWIPDTSSWVNGCDDVQWSSLGGICLKRLSDSCDFAILKEGKDTLSVHHSDGDCSASSIRFEGRYINAGWNIFSTDSAWRISDAPVMRTGDQRSVSVCFKDTKDVCLWY